MADVHSVIDRYRELLEARHERLSPDSLFSNTKNQLEKTILERLEAERDPQKASSLIELFAELASFVPEGDYELYRQCLARAHADNDVRQLLELMDTYDHDAIQKELDVRKDNELIRYYALHRRVMRERLARRQQAQAVMSLNAPAH
ncbi:MAG: hypothetical protein ACR2IF_16540 [Terriglobales bacterium]